MQLIGLLLVSFEEWKVSFSEAGSSDAGPLEEGWKKRALPYMGKGRAEKARCKVSCVTSS